MYRFGIARGLANSSLKVQGWDVRLHALFGLSFHDSLFTFRLHQGSMCSNSVYLHINYFGLKDLYCRDYFNHSTYRFKTCDFNGKKYRTATDRHV